MRELEPGDVHLHALEDRDLGAVRGHEVLGLRPGVARDGPATEHGQQDHHQGDPAQAGPTPRGPGRVPQLLGVDRGGRCDRLQLAGVALPVPLQGPAQHAAAARLVRGRADQHRSDRRGRRELGVVGGRVGGEHLGHDDGHVVGGPAVQGGLHQAQGGGVDGVAAQHQGQVGVGHRARAAVRAQHHPVADLEVDVEQVRLGVVHAVDGPQDDVPVRVDPGLLLGDPALVDQGLHERVVLGQLAQLAAAEQVGPAVAHVDEAQPGAVEQRGGHRGAGAVELGVLLDHLGELVVDPVHGPGQGGQHLGAGGLVQPAEQVDRGGAGHVAVRRAADTVGDHQQVLAGVAGVLVLLAVPPEVGDRGEPQPQRGPGRGGIGGGLAGGRGHGATSSARRSSCPRGPGCRAGSRWPA